MVTTASRVESALHLRLYLGKVAQHAKCWWNILKSQITQVLGHVLQMVLSTDDVMQETKKTLSTVVPRQITA